MPRFTVLVICCFALLVPLRAAVAHAVVVAAVPAARSIVPAGAVPVDLEFNSRVDAARSRLSVIDAGGRSSPLEIDPTAPANRIRARAEGLQPGKHVLEWYVLSTDGHITRGRLQFEAAASD